MKILITGGGSGGHISPALSVIEQLRLNDPAVQLLYVGGNLTMEGSTGKSLEATLVEPTGVSFRTIRTGKLVRGGFSRSTISRLWGVVPGIFEAWLIIRKFKPNVVFSSGGYVSLPVVIAAWLQRIPIVIHEQTASVGLTNSMAGKLASKIAVTFPQSAKYFNSDKVVVTGNPIQPAILQPNISAASRSDFGRWLASPGLPIIYITGGGLGSHIINQIVEAALPTLLSDYRLVHQCGAHAGFKDYERLQAARQDLTQVRQENYWVSQHFSPEYVGWIYYYAQAVVARAGANTVLELAVYGLPTIFIPIPWVTHDEQTKNAQVLVDAGTSIILPEQELTVERLVQEIAGRLNAGRTIQAAAQKARGLVDIEAAIKISNLVYQAGAK